MYVTAEVALPKQMSSSTLPSLRAWVAGLMQEGRWQEAEEALREIETRCGPRALTDLRDILALHRSAEQSWEQGRRSSAHALAQALLRTLIVADVGLMLVLLLVWLLGRSLGA